MFFIGDGVGLEDPAERRQGKWMGQAGQLAGSDQANKALSPWLWGEAARLNLHPVHFCLLEPAGWQSANTLCMTGVLRVRAGLLFGL